MTGLRQLLWTQGQWVSAALIAGLWPGRSISEVTAWIERAPTAKQRWVVFGTLAALLAASFGAAAFGLVGLCLFWLTIIVIVR